MTEKDSIIMNSYKMGIVLDEGLVWCLNDFDYYTIPLELHHDWFEITDCDKKREVLKNHIHDYIEFTSSESTLDNTESKINSNCGHNKRIEDFWFNKNKYSDIVAFYFTDYDIQQIIKEMEELVDSLNIEEIINSYMTYCYHKEVKVNSDTFGDDINVSRTTTYQDAYICKILPSCNYYSENARDSHSIVVSPKANDTSARLHIDLKSIDRIFIKDSHVGEPYNYRLNAYRIPSNSQQEEALIREEARSTYNRKNHIMTLVNQILGNITAKKIEIESKYHIQEAINMKSKFYSNCYIPRK